MKKQRWVDTDHLFTPPNITRLEFTLTIEVKHCILKGCGGKKFKPRKLRNGKVVIIPVQKGEDL